MACCWACRTSFVVPAQAELALLALLPPASAEVGHSLESESTLQDRFAAQAREAAA
jgi:hypothetical protein